MEQIKRRLMVHLKENLKPSRLEHTYSVAREARKLADRYGEDPDRAELAALFHDAYRNLSIPAMDMYIRQLGLPARYLGNPNLAHSKIAARMMRDSYHIEDEEMVNAVSYHTTGRAGMTLLEKIIFLADAIEPGRTYPGVEKVRAEAYHDIDRACMTSLEGTIRFLEARGAYMDPDTIEARNDLKERKHL